MDNKITGKELKSVHNESYKDDYGNIIKFAKDVEDSVTFHFRESGNYIEIGKNVKARDCIVECGKDAKCTITDNSQIEGMKITITAGNVQIGSRQIATDYTPTDKQKKIWQVELQMLDLVDSICKRHNIKYFLLHGSLLGAVRHKGFIPWDDDLDIGMLRRDYDKFLSIAEKEITHPYSVQNMWTEQDSFFGGFTKIRNEETTGIQAREIGHKSNQGIWIDILPIDNCTMDEKKLAAKEKKINKAYRLLLAKVYGAEMERFDNLQEWQWKCICQYSKLFSHNYLCRKLDAAMRLYTQEDTKDAAIFSGYGKHKILNLADFNSTTNLEFEGCKVPAPIGYENYLFTILGKDYMKFPPKEEQKPKHTGVYDPEHSYKDYIQKLTGMFNGCKGKKIILFGSGMMFEDYMKKWGGRYRPHFIVDNDENKWGRSRMGIEIKSPDALLELPAEKRHLIICSYYYKEIEKQLDEMGIQDYRIYIQKLEWIIKAES